MIETHVKQRNWPSYALGAVTTLVVVALWGSFVVPPRAHAQIPDSGAQRYEMIKELRTTNQKLGEIASILGQIRDQQGAEKESDAGRKKRRIAP
ncbi:MAG: hypothetical protein KKB50_07555 [Planctomycetes bacterium]|nr:hypothetical protein [Planctomycetota bacterium]